MDKVSSFRESVLELLASSLTWAVEVVESTSSTNIDMVARVRQGCPDYTALVALDQVGGKGRLSRTWVTPSDTAVAMSMAVPLTSLQAHWGLIPVAAGVSVVGALASFGVEASLKWPNDVFIGDQKVCGILVEVAGRTAVVGVGINVSQTEENIGYSTAISLHMAGAEVSREEVVAGVLIHLGETLELLATDAGRRSILDVYRSMSNTLGRLVRVFLDEQTYVEGEAVDIAEDGQLLVRVDGEIRPFASGDVHRVG